MPVLATMLLKQVRLKLIYIKCLVLVIIPTTILLTYFKFFEAQDESAYIGNWEKTVRDYEEKIRNFELQMMPYLGGDGEPAFLAEDEAIKGIESMKTYKFNAFLSDRMPVNRSIKDFRNENCILAENSDKINLTASIIVVFSNVHLSVLLRCIWSFVLQTPSKLLKEIILLDNASTDENLKALLDYYIRTRMFDYNVNLHRLGQTNVPVQAKLQGAKMAKGDVLVFMDPYCEVTWKWIEPLLARIEKTRESVVVPIIDSIDPKTFAYVTPDRQGFQLGDFLWSGYSMWFYDKTINPEKQVKPVPTPVMAGGLFAIRRQFFWDLGAFDEGMVGWGGENLDLSFRIWQCGGRLEVVPCSRVGHIFNDLLPIYKPYEHNDTHVLNLARTAHVWMDEYQKLFFMHYPKLQFNSIIGELEEKKHLRLHLQCRTFNWYLTNVHPKKFVPFEKAYAFGQIRNKFNMCLDFIQKPTPTRILGLYRCHRRETASQYFSFTFDGELRNEVRCAQVFNHTLVKLTTCDLRKRNQVWQFFLNGTVYHPGTKKCLSSEGVDNLGGVIVRTCGKSTHQKWIVANINFTAFNNTILEDEDHSNS